MIIIMQGRGEFCGDSIGGPRDLKRSERESERARERGRGRGREGGREIALLRIFRNWGSRASVYSLAAEHACDSIQIVTSKSFVMAKLAGVDSHRRRTLWEVSIGLWVLNVVLPIHSIIFQ